eukprot:3476591-Rhodomonas_salina.1
MSPSQPTQPQWLGQSQVFKSTIPLGQCPLSKGGTFPLGFQYTCSTREVAFLQGPFSLVPGHPGTSDWLPSKARLNYPGTGSPDITEPGSTRHWPRTNTEARPPPNPNHMMISTLLRLPRPAGGSTTVPRPGTAWVGGQSFYYH